MALDEAVIHCKEINKLLFMVDNEKIKRTSKEDMLVLLRSYLNYEGLNPEFVKYELLSNGYTVTFDIEYDTIKKLEIIMNDMRYSLEDIVTILDMSGKNTAADVFIAEYDMKIYDVLFKIYDGPSRELGTVDICSYGRCCRLLHILIKRIYLDIGE